MEGTPRLADERAEVETAPPCSLARCLDDRIRADACETRGSSRNLTALRPRHAAP